MAYTGEGVRGGSPQPGPGRGGGEEEGGREGCIRCCNLTPKTGREGSDVSHISMSHIRKVQDFSTPTLKCSSVRMCHILHCSDRLEMNENNTSQISETGHTMTIVSIFRVSVKEVSVTME